jgi:hypothetical protein
MSQIYTIKASLPKMMLMIVTVITTKMNESYMITLNMKATVFVENMDRHRKSFTLPHLKLIPLCLLGLLHRIQRLALIGEHERSPRLNLLLLKHLLVPRNAGNSIIPPTPTVVQAA